MSSAVEIRKNNSSLIFDVNPSADIEINMGGVSLLDLASRPTTYSNDFILPNTKGNEQAFGFSSQPTVATIPKIEVMVSKGLFQKGGTLSCTSFENGAYKARVNYYQNLFTENAKDVFNSNAFFGDDIIYASETMQNFITNMSNSDILNFKHLSGVTQVSGNFPIPSSGNLYKTLGMSLPHFIDQIRHYYDIKVSGNLLSNPDFNKAFLLLPTSYIDAGLLGGSPSRYRFVVMYGEIKKTIGEILKQIALLFMADVQFEENELRLNTIETSTIGVSIDGFKFTKQIEQPLFRKINRINYTLASAIIDKNSGGDFFTIPSMSGEKEFLKIGCYLPAGDGSRYQVFTDGSIDDSICICTYIVAGSTNIRYISDIVTVTNSIKMAFFSLSNFYSAILGKIYKNPVFLNAEITIDSLTADTIMATRVITSIQLGGSYWVDEMKYNLTTGKSVLKLIRL